MDMSRPLIPDDPLTHSLLANVLATMIQHSLDQDAAASVKDGDQPETAASDACPRGADTRKHNMNPSKNQASTEGGDGAAFGGVVHPA